MRNSYTYNGYTIMLTDEGWKAKDVGGKWVNGVNGMSTEEEVEEFLDSLKDESDSEDEKKENGIRAQKWNNDKEGDVNKEKEEYLKEYDLVWNTWQDDLSKLDEKVKGQNEVVENKESDADEVSVGYKGKEIVYSKKKPGEYYVRDENGNWLKSGFSSEKEARDYIDGIGKGKGNK